MKDASKHKQSFFIKTKSTPLIVSLTAEIEGETVAETKVVRYYVSPDVVRMQVEEHNWIGSLYYPQDSSPVPGILILSGSDGSSREDAVALLAAHGYAALALPYFGTEDVPKDLKRSAGCKTSLRFAADRLVSSGYPEEEN